MKKNTDIFSQYLSDKNYGTAAIDDLIAYCEEQVASIYSQQVIALLKATKRFRHLADPGPYFTTLRNIENNNAYLKQAIKEIMDVFLVAEKEMSASSILTAVMTYCTESIINRLQDLDPTDKILKLYQQGG